jgi:two-component system CheB/CheR fusion protein
VSAGSIEQQAKAAECRFRTVGIGASAGGLESLEQLFSSLPADSGMAFVVIQHLSPDFKSMMDELLARHSQMPIHLAEHGMPVEPNHVYLLPPRKEMIIREGRLLLTDKDRSRALTLPIDQFFRSLANDCGPAAVGVILSGSGTDGSRGVVDIRDAGGMVLVESPESARFDGMPLSALASGAVTQSATPEQIAGLLLASREVPSPASPGEPTDATPQAVIHRLLREQFGLDFSLYKTSTVSRRVQRRIEMGDATSLEAYVERLRSDPLELGRLYHDLLIGVTRFFRDPQAYEVLEREVVPDIIQRTAADEEIRVWVAGCATGEEAYSLAMIFVEQLTSVGRPVHLKVLATDVHRASLMHASAGVYDEQQLELVSEARRDQFFTARGERWCVTPELRQHVVFAPHNVTKDAPFTKMHLVSCRNLLIYLEPHAQKLVLSLFHFGLATGGALFLGSSETPGDLSAEFTAVNDHWRIYRKRRDIRLVTPDRLTAPRRTATLLSLPSPSARGSSGDSHLLGVYDQLLDRCMPPSFLIDEERRLVDSFGGAERYVKVQGRRPSMHVLDLLGGELRTVAAAAIHRALSQPGPVRYDGVSLDLGDGRRTSVRAEAFLNPRTQSRYVLVTLEPEDRPASPAGSGEEPGPRRLPAGDVTQERVAALEADLSHTRESLQATVEELQTSNEELQATNEELIASNEELQSTNEELHSVNEELYTVNGEHQRKIVELRVLNSDMEHLLEATDLGMLFLDGDLHVRRYTPRIAPIFNLQPPDIGRSIRHFSHSLLRPGLFDEVDRALADGTVVEEEVVAADGTTYFLRILPYQPLRPSAGQQVERGGAIGEGVVISLTDISALVRAQEKIRSLSLIVESSDDAVVGLTLGGVVTAWNAGAARLFGLTTAEAVGSRLHDVLAADGARELDDLLAAVGRGESVEHAEALRLPRERRHRDLSVSFSPVRDRSGAVIGAAAIARDVTALREAQREIAAREAHIRLLLDSTAEAIYGVDVDGICTFANRACARALGHESVEPLIGRRIEEVVRHHGRPDAAAGEHPARQVLREGRGTHTADEELVRADGSRFPVEYWSHPIRGPQGVVGAVVTFIDIAERKRAEHAIREAAQRREQFLAMLSHELRNPLAAIVSATQVLRRSMDSPGLVAHARDVIVRQSDHMARLLDDLLDVSRITRGGIDLRKEDIDLRAVVELAVEAAGPLLHERRMRLGLDLPAVPLPVRGDAARLQQVVGNLLSNAARYSERGSQVLVKAAREDAEVVLRVIDQGRGIEPGMREAIFDLFVQEEQGLDRRGGGLGVGLTLVRQIVGLHNGSVEARSEGRGRGSEFIVRLPYQDQAILTRPSEPTAAVNDSARRVALAEDQSDARQMLRVLLEQQGHIVLEATDGPSAVSLIERSHPDVAIVDIGLPDMDGYEVARRIRQQRQLDDVLLIALTGYGAAADVKLAHGAGFDDHLTKPCDSSRLAELIQRRRNDARAD